jgi:hypothetical protein
MSEQPQQSRPMTMNDVIQQDPRTQKLVHRHQELQGKRTTRLVRIQFVEGDIIKYMGGYEATCDTSDVEALTKTVKDVFYPLIKEKDEGIQEIIEIEKQLMLLEQEYQALANIIIEEMKAKFRRPPQSAESGTLESGTPESAEPPCGCSEGDCKEGCTCHVTCQPRVIDASEENPEVPGPEAA